ncbi:chemotaxis protein CheA [Qipengyuania sediminis]|uniref:chemotaxis protein CheA n=1 Tax=Qipengyuania sediminis TaxID=1532023 RepID=UPI00105A2120|nr:chemotaxis protein CheW [Qipengyuania sediminis]
MDELLADFVAETREMMEAVGGELVAWEAEPGDAARLDSIFRFVHTVKGNCGFFDFPRLERLSHAAEDALAECRAGRREPDRALVSAVLAVIDRIGEMTNAIEAGETFPEGGDEALIAALAASATDETMEPAAAPAAPAAAGEDSEDGQRTQKAALQRTIRLPVSLLDEVMKGVSDMVLARNDLARRLRESGDQPAIDRPFERLSGILADVRTAITRMRMQRLEILFGSLPRLVRDLSAELGKQVMVDFEGGDVELDREMIEMVRDPLTHIIRNAIDHGIEAPADRLKAGKREIGLLRFTARQSGNRISLVVTDDGRGVAGERLADKAVAAGLCSTAEASRMSERQRLLLMFEPGLSTADAVSAVSGRGVGMDVVRSNIEKVGGSIDVTSKPGEGTSFHLQLPLTLSIIAALTVEVDGQLYAIPRSYIEEVVFASGQGVEFARVGERQLITFRGRRVPCVALADVLGLGDPQAHDWCAQTLVLLRLASDEVFALGVDRVHDHEDVVVKPIAPAIMDTRLYGGTTLLDDGRPIMLLDVPSIAAQRGLSSEVKNRASLAAANAASDDASIAVPVMMFLGLDGRKRAIRLETVRRIDTVDTAAIDIDGARAQVVVGGEVLTLVGHHAGALPEGRCRLLRLSDGECELAHIVREVVDAAAMTGELVPVSDDPTLEGVTLIGGELVPVLDTHHLFAQSSVPPRDGPAPTCRLPSGSEWARTILQPLVRAAGYAIAPDEVADADVAILFTDEPEPVGGARATIRLSVDPADGTEGAIYRYDRDALLRALRQAVRQSSPAQRKAS